MKSSVDSNLTVATPGISIGFHFLSVSLSEPGLVERFCFEALRRDDAERDESLPWSDEVDDDDR